MKIRDIEIYRIKGNINIPEADCSIGDHIIIMDREVWAKNWVDEEVNQFVVISLTPDFIRINRDLFEKI